MAKISQEKLRRTDKLVLKSKNSGDVISTVFPNGIQAGIGQPGFNKGVKFPNLTSAPSNSTNVLYSLDGQLYFGDSEVGSGGGGDNTTTAGTGTTVAGQLYYFHTDSTWAEANSSTAATGSDQLLGIAVGTNPATDGMLLSGLKTIAATLINGTAAVGKAVFMSTTAGEYDFTKPSASNNVVRIIGYCISIDATTSDIVLRFSPDPTFIEIS